jgi:hypothetical protein
MSTQMELLQGDTILSSTHDATPTEIDSTTDHNPSVRKSVGSSTKESKFTACRPTMPWLRGCWLIKSPPPHLPKDNEEVNMHIKRLQVMLDVAIVVDPICDQEDRARGHDDDNQ